MLSLWQFVMKYYFNLCILYQLELLIVSPQSLAPQVIFVSHNYVSIAVTMKKKWHHCLFCQSSSNCKCFCNIST